MPAVKHLPPSWEQNSFSRDERSGQLLPIAVPAGSHGSSGGDSGKGAVQIHQDAKIFASLLAPGQSAAHQIAERGAYIFAIGGKLTLSGETLGPGHQARVTSEPELTLAAEQESPVSADFLLLDLP
jgi:redox-sensitive bicupin YhaK (pirin superfamily)